jgi:hypothetical protein
MGSPSSTDAGDVPASRRGRARRWTDSAPAAARNFARGGLGFDPRSRQGGSLASRSSAGQAPGLESSYAGWRPERPVRIEVNAAAAFLLTAAARSVDIRPGSTPASRAFRDPVATHPAFDHRCSVAMACVGQVQKQLEDV